MQTEFTPKDIERFWSHVDNSGGPDACWPWVLSLHWRGYGQVGTCANGKTKMYRTHRVAWIVTNGEVPDGLLVCHTCHNRKCCNPAHLSIGTPKQNTADMMALGRHNRPHAVFSDDDIREIRRRSAAGEMGKTIAADYGVTGGCISTIIRRMSYRHVP
jgi:hypothetical protein